MNIKELYKIFRKHPVICTDTRNIIKGSIFFALRGKNFNGNQFSQEAIQKGCKYAIIDQKYYYRDDSTILVKDVLEALQKLAIYHRNHLNIPIIGITGTNGKTTSKELIKCVLSTKKKCYSTKGNLNNHIGVPISILEINQSHDIAIIEMGANHLKEINFLCNICKPTYGVITNIGSAHLEGFGSQQGIINTKNELYQYIYKSNGVIFINSDDKLLIKLAKDINKITYGKKGDLEGEILNSSQFITIKSLSHTIYTNLIGEFQFYNIMLAICIGNYFRISIQDIQKAIKNYIPKNNRSQIIQTKKNTIILDAYNANPSSMKAMLLSFSKQKNKEKLCILGDMLELGKQSKKEHQKIISLCVKLKLDCYYIGKEFRKVKKETFKNKEELTKLLSTKKISNKTILLKGSRAIELEKLIDIL